MDIGASLFETRLEVGGRTRTGCEARRTASGARKNRDRRHEKSYAAAKATNAASYSIYLVELPRSQLESSFIHESGRCCLAFTYKLV